MKRHSQNASSDLSINRSVDLYITLAAAASVYIRPLTTVTEVASVVFYAGCRATRWDIYRLKDRRGKFRANDPIASMPLGRKSASKGGHAVGHPSNSGTVFISAKATCPGILRELVRDL